MLGDLILLGLFGFLCLLPVWMLLCVFGISGLVWGKIRGHRIVYLSSNTRLYKTFGIVDPWGNVRAPEEFAMSTKWLTLREDGSIPDSYEYKSWKWADEEKN